MLGLLDMFYCQKFKPLREERLIFYYTFANKPTPAHVILKTTFTITKSEKEQ